MTRSPAQAKEAPISDSDIIELRHTGTFSLTDSVALAAKAAFVDPMREGPGGERLQLAFEVEGTGSAVAVSIEQRGGPVRARVLANPDGAAHDRVRAQIERMLSLEPDGEAYARIAARDPVVAELQQQSPGVRPILFSSPYEAAARAIIGHRLQVRQAAAVHARIAAEHGVALDVDGAVMPAFPGPKRLAELPPVLGLADRKVEQLRALGAAAAHGLLDTDRLRAMDRDAAMVHLQKLAGIGPFSAELILIRGMGDPDAFPRSEMKLQRAMAAAYDLGDAPASAALEAVAETWRPYRSWVGLLLRNR